jgi:DNA-binding CsgD family transcriptional regulator
MTLKAAAAYAARGRGRRRRPERGWASLTPTELTVAKAVADGLSNPQIAERMFISRKTVATHLTSIFRKLSVSSRAELAAQAARAGG